MHFITSQHHNITQDGRIGIYDPEQRKARIELFHSKRAARIWRKRIKYDCRKELADSRPRIKGRFLKRSDMNLPPEEIQRIYGGQLPKNAKATITLPKNGLTPPPPYEDSDEEEEEEIDIIEDSDCEEIDIIEVYHPKNDTQDRIQNIKKNDTR